MKSNIIIRFAILVILLILACSAYASGSIHECKLLQIYIDSNNRIFWNICNPADSLPYLLPSDSNTPDSLDYKIDMRGLYDLIQGKIKAISKLRILIKIHPKAHYLSMDRILTAMHWIEWVWNDKTAYDLGISANELDRKQKFLCRFAICDWEKRDDRILDAVWKKRNILPAKQTKITSDQTFAFKFDNGFWDNKISDEHIQLVPKMAKPKVGIPKPVADDERINYDPSPGVPINRKPVDSTRLKKLIARISEPDTRQPNGYLPAEDEFVLVEIPAEQIYYRVPEYPRLAQNAGMEAVVWVKALVDKMGKVRDAMILKSSGSKAGFDEASLQAAYKCRYKPAIQNGRPVAVWVSYQVEFKMPKDSKSPLR